MRQSRQSRGLPTSRAYWELKADQMMNRVFAPDAPIDLETLAPATPSVAPAPRPGLPPLPTAVRGGRARSRSDLTVLALAVLGGFGLAGVLGGLVLLRQWTGLQNSLSNERNLLLVERLRTYGPAATAPQPIATPPAPVLDPLPATATRQDPDLEALPPPPPEEPWMTQLSELPAPRRSAQPLRVPLSQRLVAAAPAATPLPGPAAAPVRSAPAERPSGPLPQLVGLVGAPGGGGSAIFQLGDSSVNVNVGEAIGGSGWRLRSADAESALIERGSERRRISIVAGG